MRSASRAKPDPMRNMPACARSIFFAKPELIRKKPWQKKSIMTSSLRAKKVMKSGSYGLQLPSSVIPLISALPPPNRPTWPSMPFSWRSSSIISITSTTFSRRPMKRGRNFFLLQPLLYAASWCERSRFRSEGNEIWELWLAASKLGYTVDQCIATTEPAYLAKYAFQLAQLFNNFYHKHHILTETDEARKKFLLATTAVVRRELVRALALPI